MFKTAYGDKERYPYSGSDVSLAKQSFKDICDVNRIMDKWRKTGVIDFAIDHEAHYDDFLNVTDFHAAQNQIIEATSAFFELPAHIRKRFENDASKFVEFVQDENNLEEMYDLNLAIRPDDYTPPVVEEPSE